MKAKTKVPENWRFELSCRPNAAYRNAFPNLFPFLRLIARTRIHASLLGNNRRWRFRVCLNWIALTAVFSGVNTLAVGEISAAGGKTYVFRGTIKSVGSRAESFTLISGNKAYVFRVTPETTLVDHGVVRKFSKVWGGQNAEVSMKLGPGGEGIATEVKLVSKGTAFEQSVLAATAPDGRILAAEQVSPLIVHKEWAPGMWTAFHHVKAGVFLLAVRGDGTVSGVEKLTSTGHAVLDVELAKAFRKWRFKPGSVKEVRVPAYYVSRRR